MGNLRMNALLNYPRDYECWRFQLSLRPHGVLQSALNIERMICR